MKLTNKNHKLIYSKKYFLKRNKYFTTSNIKNNVAYYYTLYTFKSLISKIR